MGVYHVSASTREVVYLRSRLGTNFSRGAAALGEPLFDFLCFFENGLPDFLPEFLTEAGLLLRRGF